MNLCLFFKIWRIWKWPHVGLEHQIIQRKVTLTFFNRHFGDAQWLCNQCGLPRELKSKPQTRQRCFFKRSYCCWECKISYSHYFRNFYHVVAMKKFHSGIFWNKQHFKDALKAVLLHIWAIMQSKSFPCAAGRAYDGGGTCHQWKKSKSLTLQYAPKLYLLQCDISGNCPSSDVIDRRLKRHVWVYILGSILEL